MVKWRYSTDIFLASTIERMAAHFRNLVASIVANPDQKLSELSLTSPAERDLLLRRWNDTAMDFPREKVVHQLVEEQVARDPGRKAVVNGPHSLTYG